MEKRKPEEYAFSCSVAKSEERMILGKSDLLRVLETKQVSQALNILGEFGYGEGKEISNLGEFEPVLRKELSRVRELVDSIAPEKSEIQLFFIPNDYHNVKALLKAEALGIDGKPYLIDGGNYSIEKISEAVRERNDIFLSSEMKHGIDEAMELFSKSRDPQVIDIILDKACYMEMKSRAEATEIPFIIDYVSLVIDLMNCVTFVRTREIGKPWSFFQKVFVEGGTVEERLFTNNYEEPYPQFADRVAPMGFRDIFALGAVETLNTGKYTLLEKLCDDKRMLFLKDARYVSFGIAPIIGLYVAKESEIKNLRMIFTGKLSGAAPEVIAERLRETYV